LSSRIALQERGCGSARARQTARAITAGGRSRPPEREPSWRATGAHGDVASCPGGAPRASLAVSARSHSRAAPEHLQARSAAAASACQRARAGKPSSLLPTCSTRREDCRLKFYELRDNLWARPCGLKLGDVVKFGGS